MKILFPETLSHMPESSVGADRAVAVSWTAINTKKHISRTASVRRMSILQRAVLSLLCSVLLPAMVETASAGGFIMAWERTATGSYAIYGAKCGVDNSGNIYVQSLDYYYGPHMYRYVLATLNRNGQYMGATTLLAFHVMSFDSYYINDMVFDSQNVYGTGIFHSYYTGYFSTLLKTSGPESWASCMDLSSGANCSWGYKVGVDGTGSVYMAGTYLAETAAVQRVFDVYQSCIAKFDRYGTKIWQTDLYSNGSASSVIGMTVESNGYIYATGHAYDWSNEKSQPWSNRLFLAKMDYEGRIIWRNTIGCGTNLSVTDLKMIGSNAIYVFHSSNTIAQFDDTGALNSERSFKTALVSNEVVHVSSMAIYDNNTILLGGDLLDTSTGVSSGYIGAFNLMGNCLSRYVWTSNCASVTDIKVDPSKYICVAGSHYVALFSLGSIRSAANDFNGDGKSDLAIYDAAGYWFILSPPSTVLAWARQWGFSGTIPITGDYDADGVSDLAVINYSDWSWYIYSFNKNTVIAWNMTWGMPGAIPIPGDYDGDRRNDLAVFDANAGAWYILALDNAGQSSVIAWAKPWGWPGATPVFGDYDGDGKADLATFDKSTGKWYIQTLDNKLLAWGKDWGWPGAVPVSGDYDGDAISDLAAFDNVSRQWYVTTLNNQVLGWGVSCGGSVYSIPVPGDYDGDSASDLAVFDYSTATWYVRKVNGQAIFSGVYWGWPGAYPVGSAW